VVPGRGAVKHYRTGRTLVDIPRGTTQVERFGGALCQIHRSDLHQALVAAVQSGDRGCVRLAANWRTSAGRPGRHCLFANGQNRPRRPARGLRRIRSAVRARLFGTEDPRFTGYVAWRGLVPMERVSAALVVPDSAVWISPGHFLTRYKIRRGEVLNYIAIARTNSWVAEGWSVRSTVDALLPNSATSSPRPARS